ncbi:MULTISPECIES: R3H domain-containing nucleic acid-binding protein [unclassified Rothia (in: high G+C Gram-positive bacteria)]|uniref:Jag family protein n=1 Tax=unclassified Rothia (in: high G+C Gram-positive bacteria) TaxID=2689056 RepID=UPI00195DA5DE|nr:MULTISPECIES: R3H domain-containing nucleic acid-binding protein [unclassified Rothia (in: high G+C Gram-positive bacteria)]MBM7051806.1 RNA-binding protein [Rothia sp. ZJ1223]QRZ61578.1 RNA-binding protein [Rothia sp. ZJ932]
MSETEIFDEIDITTLEEEGDIAADYLEELLDIADIDGDIDIEIRNNRNYISVVTDGEENEDLRALIGSKGEVLDSLQELVRLSVLASTGNRSRLILDIANHRAGRQQRLAKLAMDAITSVQENGEEVHLPPLGAYERKLVHDLVAEHGLISASQGEGRDRHIVISVESE